MCMASYSKMTENIEPRNKWLPDSIIKYTRLPEVTEWWPGSLKHQVPKSVRRKILLVACIILLYSCYNCYIICSGACSVLKMKDNFISAGAERVQSGSNPSPQDLSTSCRLPSCIIIGVRKAGTRALLHYLSLHPDIVTNVEEQHFFNTDSYNLGLDHYRKQMPPSRSNQITVEKTPAYFTDLMTPERIYRMNNSIKLILIVREPVIRLISDYTQLKYNKVMRNKTVEPLEKLLFDKHGDINTDYKAVQRSMYFHYFTNWLEFFSRDQIHISDGDILITNPYSELYKIETFLNLPHKIPNDIFYFNASKGFFCVADETLMTPCLSETKGRPHPKIAQEIIDQLHDYYRPRNQLFFKLAQRTFDWP